MTIAFTPASSTPARELVPLSEVARALDASGQALWARLQRAGVEVCRPPIGSPGESSVYRDDFERLLRLAETPPENADDAQRTRGELQDTLARLRAEIARLDAERRRILDHLALQEEVHRTNQGIIRQLEDRLRQATAARPRKPKKVA